MARNRFRTKKKIQTGINTLSVPSRDEVLTITLIQKSPISRQSMEEMMLSGCEDPTATQDATSARKDPRTIGMQVGVKVTRLAQATATLMRQCLNSRGPSFMGTSMKKQPWLGTLHRFRSRQTTTQRLHGPIWLTDFTRKP